MPVVDDFDNAINELEERVFLMKNSNNQILEEIMDLRRSVARLKRFLRVNSKFFIVFPTANFRKFLKISCLFTVMFTIICCESPILPKVTAISSAVYLKFILRYCQ